jgi:protein phosphatase
VLGASAELEVDTWTVEARDGDVFLLCSDGLSGLVRDEEIASRLSAEAPLERTLRALVRAANEAGGDDNITAVAFRVHGEPHAPDRDRQAALDEDTLTEADRIPVIRDEIAEITRPVLRAGEPRRGRRHWVRRVVAAVVVLGLGAAAVVASVVGLRWAHFVGVDEATGRVAVFQGVPVELGGGHTLYTLVRRSRVAAASLPQQERRRLFDHTLRSSDEAARIVDDLERGEP